MLLISSKTRFQSPLVSRRIQGGVKHQVMVLLRLPAVISLLFLPALSLWSATDVTCSMFSVEPLSVEDIRIEETDDEAIMLIVRKQCNMNSLLLTEATRVGNKMLVGTVHSYWVTKYNPINGDEKRILNGEILRDAKRYYLVDSTPEHDDEFGQAFRIRVPYVLQYGFPWTPDGTGTVSLIESGVFRFNIRAFEERFADYDGAYQDNTFTLVRDND